MADDKLTRDAGHDWPNANPVDPLGFSGHSLRAGFATSAAVAAGPLEGSMPIRFSPIGYLVAVM